MTPVAQAEVLRISLESLNGLVSLIRDPCTQKEVCQRFLFCLKVEGCKRIQVLAPYASSFLSAMLNKIEGIMCSTASFQISSCLFKRKAGLSLP